MKRSAFAVLATTLITMSSPAAAAPTYDAVITVRGSVARQTSPGTPTPSVQLGDLVQVSAAFNSSQVISFGDYKVAFLYGDPDFEVRLRGFRYSSFTEISDGYPVYERTVDYYDRNGNNIYDYFSMGAPAIAFKGRRVIGLSGLLVPNGLAPELDLGSVFWGSDGTYNSDAGEPLQHFTSRFGRISGEFDLFGDFDYGNRYEGPSFSGVWHFANSNVQGLVPEPTTWLLMVLGVGGMGMALRRRRGCAESPVSSLTAGAG